MSGILNAFVGGTYSSAPVNTVAPAVTGTTSVGQTLSSTTGTWTGLPAPTFTYQWYRSPSTAISGETSSTYVLAVADVGNTIFCRVTATNSVSAVSADSNTTATITANVPLAPTIGTATAVNAGSATVTYTASASDGGSTITSYTAVSSPGGVTGTLATSGSGTITVSGLTPSTSYTFTVFATNAIGNSPSSVASNSITTPAVAAGQVAFTSVGTYSWTVPAGVTSVSVVCVGGGGGGSRNGEIVLPNTAGGQSYFNSPSLVRGGGGGTSSTTNVTVQAVGGTYTGDGGGNGGNGLSTGVQIPFYGGGGAGGYSGNGGYGGQGDGSGQITLDGQAGSGGGASGGGWAGGGGVGILGQGASGAAVTVGSPTGGRGGSGGDNGFTYSQVPNSNTSVNKGGNYGGGGSGTYWVQGAGGGLGYKNNISVTPGASITVVVGDWGYPNKQSPYDYGGHGGMGAVRIIWAGGSGITRAFPSTNTGDL
jgi:hypothetical protein